MPLVVGYSYTTWDRCDTDQSKDVPRDGFCHVNEFFIRQIGV